MTAITRRISWPKVKVTKLAALAAFLLVYPLLSQGALQEQTRTVSYEYDPASGLLTKEIVEPFDAQLKVTTTYGYDAYGNKTSVAVTANVASGLPNVSNGAIAWTSQTRTSATAYESGKGRYPISSSNARGHTEYYAFDARWGTRTSLTGPNGLVSSAVFDNYGRKTSDTAPGGIVTTITYLRANTAFLRDSTGPYTQTTSSVQSGGLSLPPATQTANGAGQVLDSVRQLIRNGGASGTAEGSRIVMTYDALGRKQSQSRPFWVSGGKSDGGSAGLLTTYTYDQLGRTVSETAPDGSTSTFSFAPLISTVTNPKGETKTSYADAGGKTQRIVDAMGQNLHYRYDALGNLTETYDHYGVATAIQYNVRGHKVGMIDPHKGTWQYTSNGFGELVLQRDGKGQYVAMQYDDLGRMTARQYPQADGGATGDTASHTANWYYETTQGGASCRSGGSGSAAGQLCEVTSTNGYRRTATYDALLRTAQLQVQLGTSSNPAILGTFKENFSYDALGRLSTKTYPQTGTVNSNHRLVVSYDYRSGDGLPNAAYLSSLASSTPTVIWQLTQVDAAGQFTQEQVNGKTVVNTYNAQTGRLSSREAGDAPGMTNLYAAQYQYDQLGNVTQRNTVTAGQAAISENFGVDSLSRLKSYSFSSTDPGAVNQWVGMQYLANGNIHYKSDVGWYNYGNVNGAQPSKPAQLKTILGGSQEFNRDHDNYDANGNQRTVKSGTGNSNAGATLTSLSYTAFDLPFQIVKSTGSSATDGTSTYQYGPELQRVRAVTPDGPSTSLETLYLNGENSLGLSLEKLTRTVAGTPTVTYRHYVSAGGRSIAQLDIPENTDPISLAPVLNTGRQYFLHDHLGSVVVVLNNDNTVAERLNYDPWGRRRTALGSAEPELTTSQAHEVNRGFTMHEHLSSVGLIHMNGRLYDPILGRFLQADPLIPDATNLQSYNRYSYVMNSPLVFTDPSGFSPFWKKKWFKAVAAIGVGLLVGDFVDAYMGLANWAAEGTFTAFQTSVASGAAGGFAAGLVSTGGDVKASLQQGLIGGFSAGLFNLAGDVGVGRVGGFEHYAAHAGAGCLVAVASGGKCGRGAASAVVSKFTTLNSDFGTIGNGIATVIAGGTTSVIGGGKFANGATSALYGYLYNCLGDSHGPCSQQWGKKGAFTGAGLGLITDIGCSLATGGMCVLSLPVFIVGGAAVGGSIGASAGGLADALESKIHANSWLSPDRTSVYVLTSIVDDSVLKYGITNLVGNEVARYSAAEMAQLNARMTVIATFDSRAPARMLEIGFCSAYTVTNGKLPPASAKC